MLRTLSSTSRIVSTTSARVLRLSSRMSVETTSSTSTADFGTSSSSSAVFDPEAKIAELNCKLPTPSKSVANYVMCKRVGNILYTAGHLPLPADAPLITGKVGADLTTDQGYDAARYVGLNILATIKNEIGDLKRIKQIVKLTGFVNCVDGFSAQPKVVNGCSDLFANVLGERGKHSRSAVGTNALPLNVPVEIEAIVEVE